MKSARWQEIERLYNSALERKPEERAAYLREACGDKSLRNEVESLLAHQSEAKGFIEAPAMEVAAKALAGDWPAAAFFPDQTFGHYSIIEKIGAGGMGMVYKARDKRLNRIVALKFPHPEESGRPHAERRFRREAEAIAALNHPNIAVIYEVGQWSEQPFLALEYLPGGTLKQKIIHQPIQFPELQTYVRQLASGLAYAHAEGILHRDIKPGNAMFAAQGHLKLVDFGLAKWYGNAQITDTITPAGTVAYMAPEVLTGGEATPRSDLYSLAVLLYELATGARPFVSERVQSLIFQILNKDAVPLSSLRPDLPGFFTEAVSRAMARQPADRFESVDELLGHLEGHESSLPRPSSPAPPTAEAAIVAEAATGSIPAQAPPKRRVFTLVLAGILLAAAVSVSPFLLPRLLPYLSWSGHETHAFRTLVVLPFENLGGDSANQRLCDGLQETVTSMLSRLEEAKSSLVVVPSSEVRRNQVKTIADARKQFNADQVIAGSVQANGDSLQFTINMADAQTRRQTDSRILSVNATELAELQRRLSGEIRGLVGGSLASGAAGADSGETTRDSQAYRLYLQGEGALQNRKYDEAADLLKNAVERDPEYSLARAKLAEAYLRRNLSTREPKWLALADAEIAVALKNGPIPQAVMAQAMIRKATGDYAKAIDLFQQAIAQDPGNMEAYSLLAQAFEASGRSNEAEATLQNAVRLRPGYWPTYNSLATYYFGKHEFAKSEEAYRTGLSLAPENPTLHYNLGALYFKMERWDDAAKSFDRSLSLAPTALGHANLGVVLFYKGKYEESARHARMSAGLQPGNPVNWGNLGDALWQLPGQRENAKTALERAIVLFSEQLGLTPGNVGLRKSYAVYLAKLGRADEAKKQIKLTLENAPGNMDAHYGAARVYALLGDQDRALAELASCLKLGYPASEISREPDLEPIRRTQKYQQLETESRKGASK